MHLFSIFVLKSFEIQIKISTYFFHGTYRVDSKFVRRINIYSLSDKNNKAFTPFIIRSYKAMTAKYGERYIEKWGKLKFKRQFYT